MKDGRQRQLEAGRRDKCGQSAGGCLECRNKITLYANAMCPFQVLHGGRHITALSLLDSGHSSEGYLCLKKLTKGENAQVNIATLHKLFKLSVL